MPQAPNASAIRISQVYGGGGSATAGTAYKNDYVELFNSSLTPVDISGWSLQYGSQTGNFASSATNLYTFTTGTTIAPGKYLLIQLGSAGTAGANLSPTPDFTTTNLSMAAASGKVALANISTSLGCGGTVLPCTLPDSRIVDLVAWGNVTATVEITAVNYPTALNSTQGAVRSNNGCTDTDNNYLDFTVVASPTLIPRNSASPAYYCSAPEPNLGLAKSGPTLANAGDAITYTISLSNTGLGTATGSILTDTLPTEVAFVTYTSSLPANFTQPAAQTLVWDLGDVASDASGTITVYGTISPSASGGSTFTNTATASTTASENQLANNTASAATQIAVPDLAVLKTGPATATAGDVINYTITISNSGTATAASTLVTDTLPAEVSFVTYTTVLPVSFSQPDAQTLVWDLGNLANGAGGSITVEGVISAGLSNGTVFTNSVAASATTPEIITSNNTAAAATLIGAPDLVLVKIGPASVMVGDPVVYTLSYTNTGDLSAAGVTLVDQLPAGLNYVSDSLGTGVQIGGRITWTLGTLPINATGSLVLTATAVSIGDQANIAIIGGTTADSNPLDNVSAFTTTVLGSDPFVSKTGSAIGFGGELVTYTIVYGNHGNTATSVTMTDTLPVGFTTADIASDTSGLASIDGGNARSWTTTLA
ncbi:MAG TPA: lamin tail domain-containing protein, partial [Anaerolineae bacterium]|nr:lamin tail domain-containing protein [Anaerolineae bacterium]